MKRNKVLGIDPGIANCGFAVVCYGPKSYNVVASELVRTASCEPVGARLEHISLTLLALLSAGDIDGIAIERVYHNKNISSSLSTAKVIGLVELTAHQAGIPVYLLTPQQVKKASGLGTDIDKAQVRLIVSRLFGVKIASHHIADALLCGLETGCLLLRKNRRKTGEKTVNFA